MKDDKDLMEPEIRPAEDPKDCGFYETGNTRPPKNHHKLVAVLLVVYIVLGGMFGILFQNVLPHIGDTVLVFEGRVTRTGIDTFAVAHVEGQEEG